MRIFYSLCASLILLIAISVIPPAARAAQTTNLTVAAGGFSTITGTGFGEYGIGSGLCLDVDASMCLRDEYIALWTDTTIVFYLTPDTETPQQGYFYLFRDTSTADKNSFIFVKSIPYKMGAIAVSSVMPESLDAPDYAQLSPLLSPSSTVIIRGTGFGQMKGSIFFVKDDIRGIGSSHPAEIVSWEETKIVITTPMVKSRPEMMSLVFRDGTKQLFPIALLPVQANDPLLTAQRYLLVHDIPSLWQAVKPVREVVVAVIDDGVYVNHADLKGRMWKNAKEKAGNGKDDDKNGYKDDVLGWNFLTGNNEVGIKGSHGTLVAGIIAANRNNAVGIAGIAQKAKILPLTVCNTRGCSEKAIVRALYYAVDNGARVINLSLGGQTFAGGYTDVFDAPIAYARKHGVLVVAAAGNGDALLAPVDMDEYPQSPVCNGKQDAVIGVGALDRYGEGIAEFSNTGACVEVNMIGEGVISLAMGSEATAAAGIADEYDTADGTSFSAPQVAGIAAEVFSAYPAMTAQEFYRLFMSAVKNGRFSMNAFVAALKTYDAKKDAGIVWKVPQTAYRVK